jgi:DNA-binding MarR family transcriptional regulator
MLQQNRDAPEVPVDRTSEDVVLLDLARAVVGISTAAADRLGGISVVQLRALTVLRDLGTATLGELARGMAVTVSTTSRLVDRLVAAGLVVREPAAHSRRALALRTSLAGSAVLDRYDEERLGVLRRALQDVPEPDAVVAALAAITAAVRSTEPVAAS